VVDMSIYLLVLSVVILVITSYKRYFPVKKVPCIENGFKDHNAIILDIRDYNESVNDIPHGTLHIPYAYLRRFNKEISHDNLHVIASDRLELNLGLRFLMKKGFKVISYEIMDCPCKKKGGLEHGIR
jgi:rhodanese-related sulfurtransferase